MPAVEADQEDGARNRIARRPELYLREPPVDRERNRHFSNGVSGGVQSALDLSVIRTDGLPPTIDDHLRRVNGREPEQLGVTLLALGCRGAGEWVLPPEPVPVIDVEGQCQQIWTAGQFGEQCIGRWAGGAALGGEQFYDDRSPSRRRR